MIEKWELAHFPFEKDKNRYKARINGTEKDLSDLIEKIPATCGSPFATLSQNYNWAFYVYKVTDKNRDSIIKIFKDASPNGKVVKSAAIQVDKELPPMLEDILHATAETLTKGQEPPQEGIEVKTKPSAPMPRFSEPEEPSPIQEEKPKEDEGFIVSPGKVPPTPRASVPGTKPMGNTGSGVTPGGLVSLPLNPKYTFPEFIVGTNNRFTHAAAMAVAEKPGTIYNPFFIFGDVGLGKTHLMQAIGHFVMANNPDLRYYFTSTENFVSQVIEAIRTGGINQLRDQYRNLDLLLIDDIQFLSGSESTQEEFFHVFNNLHAMQKQIVITSDRPPKQLATLEDRLRSRFEWGLISDLKSPNLETRVAILKKKSIHYKVELNEDQYLYIAEKATASIRELEGALKKINAYTNLTKENVDMDYLATLFEDSPGQETKPKTSKPPTTTTGSKPPAKKVVPPTPKATPKPAPKPAPKKPEPEPLVKKPAPTPLVQKPGPAQTPKQPTPPSKPQELDPGTRPVEVVFFYPRGKQSDIETVFQKFDVIMKKHKLKIRLVRISEKSYSADADFKFSFFTNECKALRCHVAIVLGPPASPLVQEEDFLTHLTDIMDEEQIAFQFIPWTEMSKDYRYLNCALDLSLLPSVSGDNPK